MNSMFEKDLQFFFKLLLHGEIGGTMGGTLGGAKMQLNCHGRNVDGITLLFLCCP